MACGPCGRRQEQLRYQVITKTGRTVYRSNSVDSANRIAQNYPGSTVKDTQAAA